MEHAAAPSRRAGPARVLLVSANRRGLPEAVPPIGLAFLAGALRPSGTEVRVLDLLLEADPDAAIDAALSGFRPGVVGLSIRNLDDTSWPASRSFLPEAVAVSRRIREAGVPVVLGGPAVSIAPEALLHRLDLDVAVKGEGEGVFPALVEALAAGREPPDLPGVVVRGRTSTPASGYLDLRGLPGPDWGVLDLAAYREREGVVGMQSKRGCPRECTYCVYPGVEGTRIRQRSPETVASEIREVHERFGIGRFFIVDGVFNAPASHAREVARAIGDLRLPVRYGCYLSPRNVPAELAEELLRSGCEGVEFGTDALAPAMLERLRKGFTAEEAADAARVCRKAGLPQCHHLIFGTPGETEATVAETLERAEAMAPDAILAMCGVRVYPGTELARELFDGDPDPPDLLDPHHYVAPEVAGTLEERLLDHARRHPGWIIPGLGHNYDETMLTRLRQRGTRGPAWLLASR